MVKSGFQFAASLTLAYLFIFLALNGAEAQQLCSVAQGEDQQGTQPAGLNQLAHVSWPDLASSTRLEAAQTNSLLSAIPSGESRDGDYLDEIAGDGLYQWLPGRFPIRVFVEPGDGVPGYKPGFKDVLTNSLNQWCLVSGGRLSWRQVNDKNQSDLVCRWTDRAPEEEKGTEAGRTRLYATLNTGTNRGVIKNATMDLLTNPPDRDFTADEIRKAYLHECGHAFGLSGHSSERNDIMTAVVTRMQPTSLSGRDIASIRRLYSEYPVHPEQALGNSTTIQSSSTVPRD